MMPYPVEDARTASAYPTAPLSRPLSRLSHPTSPAAPSRPLYPRHPTTPPFVPAGPSRPFPASQYVSGALRPIPRADRLRAPAPRLPLVPAVPVERAAPAHPLTYPPAWRAAPATVRFAPPRRRAQIALARLVVFVLVALIVTGALGVVVSALAAAR